MAGQNRGAFGLEDQGFRDLKAVNWNLTVPELYERSIRAQEGHVAKPNRLIDGAGLCKRRKPIDQLFQFLGMA